MFYVVDRDTPQNAPDVLDVTPPAPLGMYLGAPLPSSLPPVTARVTSLRHLCDMWWIGPYFVISPIVLEELKVVGERRLQVSPLILLDRKKKITNNSFTILNMLENVGCLDTTRSRFTKDEDGIVDEVEELFIDPARVPSDRYLFRLAERADILLARDILVDRLTVLSIRGVRFLPVGGETS
jgi:hypothetical protein